MNPPELKKIKNDLGFLSDYNVVLFGSYVEGGFNKNSDIDVAVITKDRDRKQNFELYKNLIGKTHPIYEIRIFELLPLKIKMSIINNFKVLFGNRIDLSEYFYYYRKLWNDTKHRIFDNEYQDIDHKIKLLNKLEKKN
ncbi:MAG: DNA polymerase subunit beta [Candidatus Lokiarchaeota archaeon]|nr:DNA polymerase subunit beta [Candidatus Lokiarchaeota archaeon]